MEMLRANLTVFGRGASTDSVAFAGGASNGSVTRATAAAGSPIPPSVRGVAAPVNGRIAPSPGHRGRACDGHGDPRPAGCPGRLGGRRQGPRGGRRATPEPARPAWRTPLYRA